jgi:putative peptide zinc metalloprotease protein
VGIYLVFPAFYTDVTDGYRLGRWGRVRTDLGGVWFHALFALGVITAYALAPHPALLLVVILIDIDVVRQFMPFVRLDGYWVLADLTGVPDPLAHGAATIRSLMSRRTSVTPGAGASVPHLRPAARIALTIHLALAFLALPMLLLLAGMHLPTITRVLWASLREHSDAFARSIADGQVIAATAGAARVGVLTVQLLAIGWFLYAIVFRPARGAWRWIRMATATSRIGG